jgi:hypothetical protein
VPLLDIRKGQPRLTNHAAPASIAMATRTGVNSSQSMAVHLHKVAAVGIRKNLYVAVAIEDNDG